MTKEQFFKQIDNGAKFPTTEQEVVWWEEWMELHPEEVERINKKMKEGNEKQANEYMAKKIIFKHFLETNSENDYGEFRLVWSNGHGYIHPLGRNGETLDFDL